MTAPNEPARWATSNLINGADNKPNKVEPTEEKKNEGFNFPEKPSRSELNWWMNNVGNWIAYLNTTVTDAGINQNFAQDAGATTGLDFGLEAGKVFLGTGDPLEVIAQTVTVTDDATTFVYLDLTQSGTPNNMPSAAASWPIEDYIPLYEVVAASGSISTFTDFRTWAIQGGAGAGGALPENEELDNQTGTIFNLTTLSGLVNTDNTWVYVDNQRLEPSEYSVTGTSQITLNSSITNQELLVTKLSPISGVLHEVEEQIATEGQDLFTLTQLPDNKNLTVYITGVFQGNRFTRVGTNQIRLDMPQDKGALVQFVRNANAGDFLAVPSGGIDRQIVRKQGSDDGDYDWEDFPISMERVSIQLSNSPGDLVNDIQSSAGECRDSTNSANLISSSIFTKKIDVAWVAGDNQGGYTGSGALSTGFYNYFIIGKADGTIDFGFDDDDDATNLLAAASGFIYFRHLGWLYWDGSQIKGFNQYGDRFIFHKPEISTPNSIINTAASVSIIAPPDPTVLADIKVSTITSLGANDHIGGLISSLDTPDIAVSDDVFNFSFRRDATTIEDGSSTVFVAPNDSSEVRLRCGENQPGNIRLSVAGWIDRRGRS